MKRLFLLLFLLPACLMSAQDLWCPEPTNRLVNDYSSMLTTEQRETLEQRLVAFDDSTSNQILVIITPSLHGCEIMELGTRIGTTWGVGQKDLKNGVLILIKSKLVQHVHAVDQNIGKLLLDLVDVIALIGPLEALQKFGRLNND